MAADSKSSLADSEAPAPVAFMWEQPTKTMGFMMHIRVGICVLHVLVGVSLRCTAVGLPGLAQVI